MTVGKQGHVLEENVLPPLRFTPVKLSASNDVLMARDAGKCYWYLFKQMFETMKDPGRMYTAEQQYDWYFFSSVMTEITIASWPLDRKCLSKAFTIDSNLWPSNDFWDGVKTFDKKRNLNLTGNIAFFKIIIIIM